MKKKVDFITTTYGIYIQKKCILEKEIEETMKRLLALWHILNSGC